MLGRVRTPSAKWMDLSISTICQFEFNAPPAGWITEHLSPLTAAGIPLENENSNLRGENRTASCAYILLTPDKQPSPQLP